MIEQIKIVKKVKDLILNYKNNQKHKKKKINKSRKRLISI